MAGCLETTKPAKADPPELGWFRRAGHRRECKTTGGSGSSAMCAGGIRWALVYECHAYDMSGALSDDLREKHPGFRAKSWMFLTQIPPRPLKPWDLREKRSLHWWMSVAGCCCRLQIRGFPPLPLVPRTPRPEPAPLSLAALFGAALVETLGFSLRPSIHFSSTACRVYSRELFLYRTPGCSPRHCSKARDV